MSEDTSTFSPPYDEGGPSIVIIVEERRRPGRSYSHKKRLETLKVLFGIY